MVKKPHPRRFWLGQIFGPIAFGLHVLALVVVLVSVVPSPALARAGAPERGGGAPPNSILPNPILFVTQVPIPADFATIGSTFANHRADIDAVGRGGDLYILYPDGSLRNLTAEAGYGENGSQRASSIAVRSPTVSWDGTKAVFSMVLGAPAQQYQYDDWYWQLYEVTGLAQGSGPAVITRVPHQPESYNNITPIYASDGRILFVSDRPRNGRHHLYPQLDEYESTPTPTGLFSLDPETGELDLLDHSPSGDFTPIVDSFGRVVFTRWDHLQRDQQADSDALEGDLYGSFDYSDESADALLLARREEVFPEPRSDRTDLLAGTNMVGHSMNSFFPWQIRQDGSAAEILDHLGRHELHSYFDRALDDDPNLEEFIDQTSGRVNPRSIGNLFQLREDPLQPGRYVAVDAPEFGTHAAGQLVALSAPPGANPDQVIVDYLTHPDTSSPVGDGDTPSAEHTGFYRNPLLLSDGTLIAAHTTETRAAGNEGTRANPVPRYRFRLRRVEKQGAWWKATSALTAGIEKTLDYWDPDVLVHVSGELWELDPVEVVARPVPSEPPVPLPVPEQGIFAQAGVDPGAMRQWLEARDLALVVVRNATTRDRADVQQPFNLAVPGGTSTIGASGTVYDIERFQFFQGDQLRGYGGTGSPDPGRRVIAQILHHEEALDWSDALAASPAGSVPIATDGSVAAFLPARRALSWQSVSPAGEPVVRERFWLTFQPGEIRSCDGCHGVNTSNQAGQPRASNAPQALGQLLSRWLADPRLIDDTWESDSLGRWSRTVP